MAYRRSLSTIRSTFLARRFNPSFSYISHDTDHTNHQELHSSGSKIAMYPTQNRSFGSYVNNPSWQFSHTFRRTGYGLLENRLYLNRYMSTSTGEADKIGIDSEVVTSITDSPNAVEAVSEIANVFDKTPDFGACALQYLFDGAHSLTGLNWWASIALTTLFIRGLSIPYLIHELRPASKFQLIKSQMKAEQLRTKGTEVKEITDYKMKELCKQSRLNPNDPRGSIKAIFVEGYLISQSSLLALYYMAKYSPSFETGGALWFTNLTIPDDMFIFASLTAMTVLTAVLCNWQGTITQIIRRLFAIVILPFSVGLHKALFCYLLPSELFFLCFGFVLRFGRVQKALGIPEIPGASGSSFDYLVRQLGYLKRQRSEISRGDT